MSEIPMLKYCLLCFSSCDNCCCLEITSSPILQRRTRLVVQSVVDSTKSNLPLMDLITKKASRPSNRILYSSNFSILWTETKLTKSLGTCNTRVSNPMGANCMLPTPTTGRTVPSAAWTCCLVMHASYFTDIVDMGVMWSVAPGTRIQEL